MRISIENDGLYMVIDVEEDGRVSLRHFAPHPYDGRDTGCYYPLLELHFQGQNSDRESTVPVIRKRIPQHFCDTGIIAWSPALEAEN